MMNLALERMKKYLFSIVFVLIVIHPHSEAQRFTDYGLIGGVSYYNGEINPTKQFYSPSPSLGGFFRVNINKRYAVRLSGIYANLRGSDNDFPNRSLTDRPPVTFTNTLMDFSSQLEFNFVPYITGEEKFINSVYIAGGIGYSLFLGSSNSLTIPFGIGFKINLTKRLSAGAEWAFRKTFIDDIDEVTNLLSNTPFNNNDWYSFFGLFISYKFVKFAADCPVYN